MHRTATACFRRRCRTQVAVLALVLIGIFCCYHFLMRVATAVALRKDSIPSPPFTVPTKGIDSTRSANVSTRQTNSTTPGVSPVVGRNSTAGVVEIFHQSWKTSELPPRFRRWSDSFAACHPTWQRRLWTDAENEDLVAKHFPWFLPTYRKLGMSVQKADVSRLFYMYKFGGVYCDLDCECLKPFAHLLTNVSLAFGAMEGHTTGPEDGRYVEEGQIENSFMYSIPEHPFIMRLIKQVERNPFGSPEETTGPYLLMREIHRMRRTKDGVPKEFQGKKYLEIFPPSYFNPFSWMANRVPACKDKGGFNRVDENGCRAAHARRNDTFILQYHTQVWLAGSGNLGKD